jgi:hypothetical protein
LALDHDTTNQKSFVEGSPLLPSCTSLCPGIYAGEKIAFKESEFLVLLFSALTFLIALQEGAQGHFSVKMIFVIAVLLQYICVTLIPPTITVSLSDRVLAKKPFSVICISKDTGKMLLLYCF